MILPTDAAARKRVPVFSGVLAYFPRALCAVAQISLEGNEQHHPGSPLYWEKDKSADHLDALVRHLLDALDDSCDDLRSLAQVAWRALAELEMRLERVDVPNSGANPPTGRPGDLDELRRERNHPMHAVALEMAEAAVYEAYPPPTIQRRTRADGTHEWRPNPEVWGSASDAEPQSVGFEPWEAAP